VEFEGTEQQPVTQPGRRFRAPIIGAAMIAVAALAVAAGMALARSGPARIGTGVVVIDTNLAYQGERAAGTGMVLDSSGEVLTNNHVIRGATTISISIPGTGRSYAAEVVGYDVSHDVAVLQARGASNLRTIPLGDSAALDVGQSVRAVGNAGGTGRLTSAAGSVTSTGRAITVSDDQGGSESLSGLIETNAAVRPGDSGGPLLDSGGHVIGMDTAASVGQGFEQASTSQGYAIPINAAMQIAAQIESGHGSATVHVGGTAFLGVEVTDGEYDNSGAVVTQVVPGSPAAAAGLDSGDVITSFGGQTISSPAGLTTVVRTQTPGAPVSATYVDPYGTSHTANLRLASGPPL